MKFYGVDLGSTDEVVQQEAMKKASAAFFESSVDGNFGQPPSGQSAEDAAKKLIPINPKKKSGYTRTQTLVANHAPRPAFPWGIQTT